LPRSERQHTDESLRLERAMADREVRDKLSTIDETADAVIKRARALADEVLAGARARVDRHDTTPLPASHPGGVEMQRLIEDDAVRAERATADETLRTERAAHISRRPNERFDTDKDLSSERARSDTALATRDEFLGLVSHDLRNMLNGMIGFAAVIEEVAHENHGDEIVMHAQRIQRSGARMNRLIGDLVDVASIEAGRLAVTRVLGDPTPVVREAVEAFQTLASGRGITLVTEIVTPSLMTAFDPARILQVLINLLSNAIKFTSAKGRVAVRVERVREEIVFAFRDTGVGIPAEMLEAVFERFLQVTVNDRRGLGLGLYISKCIVEGHGGRIWAESKLGEGSTFSFTLPIELSPAR
jgi:signal transduction histidine kinase